MNKFWFYFSARHFGEACLELYIYRVDQRGKEQVYLLPRPANDPFYPSELHLPGVRKIPTELDIDHLKRALRETPFVVNLDSVEYVASTTFRAKRGTEYADIRRVAVFFNPIDNDFYDVDNLPDNIITHHKEIIQMAKR